MNFVQVQNTCSLDTKHMEDIQDIHNYMIQTW